MWFIHDYFIDKSLPWNVVTYNLLLEEEEELEVGDP